MNAPHAPLVATLVAGSIFVAAMTASAEDTNKWVSSAALGLTLTRGNSETLLGTVGVESAKKWDHNELSLGASGAYGRNKNQTTGVEETTAEMLKGFAQYNRLFTERLYGYGRVELLHDGVADIDYRLTVSPGAGYYIIKEKTMDLSAEVGPGLIYEKTGGDEHGYWVFRAGEKYHYQLSDTAKLWQTAEWLPQVDNIENYIINAEVGLEVAISKTLSLRTVLQDMYDNQPVPGLKKNDLKWVTAIAYKF